MSRTPLDQSLLPTQDTATGNRFTAGQHIDAAEEYDTDNGFSCLHVCAEPTSHRYTARRGTYHLPQRCSIWFVTYLRSCPTYDLLHIIALDTTHAGNMMKKLRKDFQDKLADAGTVAEEAISSIRTVRSFNGETKASHSYDTEIYKSYDVAKKLALLTGTRVALLPVPLCACDDVEVYIQVCSMAG